MSTRATSTNANTLGSRSGWHKKNKISLTNMEENLPSPQLLPVRLFKIIASFGSFRGRGGDVRKGEKKQVLPDKDQRVFCPIARNETQKPESERLTGIDDWLEETQPVVESKVCCSPGWEGIYILF